MEVKKVKKVKKVYIVLKHDYASGDSHAGEFSPSTWPMGVFTTLKKAEDFITAKYGKIEPDEAEFGYEVVEEKLDEPSDTAPEDMIMEPELSTEYYESGAIRRQEWSLNGKCHREDGPAIIGYYESGAIKFQQWGLYYKYHREDGPALIRYHESGAIVSQEYWWKGTQYPDIKTDEDWTREVRQLKEQNPNINIGWGWGTLAALS